MNTQFIYSIPTTVYFGENKLGHLAEELKKHGERVLVTYGGGSIKKIGLYDKVINQLKAAKMTIFEYGGIEPNPRHTSCNEAIAICKKEKIEVLLAVGGGSVIDATKAIAAGTFYAGDVWDILTGKAKVVDALPIVDILTLSATGSEMDCGGVISNIQTKDKLALISPLLRPKASFLDPSVTFSVSKYQTACGSADILSHLFEVYFNMKGGLYMLDTVMEGLMKTVIKYTPIAMQDPDNYEARANLMWASSWAINGFVEMDKSQAWTCHPIEHEISAIYDITHGLGLAIITPRWMEYCLNEKTLPKFYQFAINVWDIDKALPQMEAAKLAIKKLSEFFFDICELKSSLSALGINDENFDIMARKSEDGGTKQGFVAISAKDVKNILQMSL